MENNIIVSDFLDNEYKDYAMYTIEQRAIPNLCDSFKTINRKVIYTGLKTVRSSSNKVSTLAGNVIVHAKYHHGNVSCEDAIVTMAQDFKNNLPLFDRIGQFGSLRAPFASASRYISVKLSKNFDLIYRDHDLLEYVIDENEQIQPMFYLGIIPMILINGGSGIAVSVASNILNREPKNVIKECLSYLKNGKVGFLKPHVNDFTGTFTVDEENHKKWYIKGHFKIENTSTVRVTELPPSVTYEKFEEILDNLMDKKTITNWDNQGKGKGIINYVVKFNRENLASMTEADISKILKLTDQVTENFTVLDENGKLKIFDSAQDILKYFMDFRLTYYHKRKTFQVTKLEKEIKNISEKARFIKLVIDNKIQVSKKSKDEITAQLVKNKFEMIDDTYNHLLYIPIYNLSNEKYNEMLNQIESKNVEIDVIKKSDPKQTYITELEELYKKL
jgi:DNA gyrase/topoisomerase IV subunit A